MLFSNLYDWKEVVTIQNITIKQRVDLTLTNVNIVTYIAASIFLPYILTAIILTFLTIYIVANRHTRQLIFIHRGTRALKLFFAYTLTIPIIYRNWTGLVVGVGVIMAFILGLYLRSIMTRKLYEMLLTLICILSLTSSVYAIIETIVNYIDHGSIKHRISAVFSHPNYFGTVVATVIIICAYKIFTSLENKWFFLLVASFNIVSLYLCKSIFAFVEVFIGIAILMFTLKKYKLLVAWLVTAFCGAFLIFILKLNLIPRLGDVSVTVELRKNIWQLALKEIRLHPLFGHGFMSFKHLYHKTYLNRAIPHSHSVYLDLLLNFGIIGTVLFLWYFVRYYISVITSYYKKKHMVVPSLILAVSGAAIVHGTADLTLLWIQTLPLFLLILAGQGSEERKDKYAHGIDLIRRVIRR